MPYRAAAQSGALSWSAQAAYAFGQTMYFQLTAENPDPIKRATLFIQAPEFPNAFSATQEMSPSTQVSVEYNLDLAQVRLAPFTTVTYWWVLETAESTISLDKQTVLYEDDQFEWRQAAENGVTVHWAQDDPGLGQLGLDIVADSMPELTDLIPVDDDLDLDIYIYPSSSDLRSALRLTGRDWVGAHAHPELGVILVTAVNAHTAAADLRQSIPHELTHLLLYRAAAPNYDDVPFWFNEGLATMMESSPNPNYGTLLETAVANQETIPFADLCYQFPAVEERALLAYAQSASFMRYIQTSYGSHAITDLVTAFADGADCQTGVERALQSSLDDLNQAWLRRQQPRSPIVRFLADNGLWLLLLLGGFGAAGLLIIIPDKNYDFTEKRR